jgi:predicted NACHT family NTPase
MELVDYKKLLETPINSVLKLVGNELKQVAQNRMLEYQTIEYKKNYFTKTLLHRSEPIKLLDFYQPLHIMLQSEARKNRDKIKRVSTANIKDLFKKTNYITLIGNAGSGKSTIVKYLFINSVETSFKIPIKVELRYLNEYKKSIIDYIYEEIFLFHKIGFSQEIVERLLNSNSFVFFFDGYDEINSNIKETVTKDIDNFISRYPENYFVITSRPYTNIDSLPLFSNYLVCDLSESEIPAFVKKQISNSEEELANKIIKAISNIDRSSYKQFLSNPLLLSMFILTFQSYSEVPQKRSDFYGQVFDTLYSIHDSVSKLSYVREKLSGLSKENFEEVLSLFSCISYFEEKFLFNLDYIETTFNVIKSKKKELSFDNEKLIEDLQVSIGIFNKEGLDYTFPHRSLQEYFSAIYISSLSQSNKKIMYKKIQNLIEKRWFYLINNQHFLLLLSEVDYNSLIINLAIPLMEIEIKRIKEKELTIYEKYDACVKLFLCSVELLRKPMREELIHTEFCDQKDFPIIFFGGSDTEFKLPIKELEKRISTETIEKNAAFIKEKGDSWIQSIVQNIEEIEKSDADIIGLI